MTAEIAILNREAIALAADSAVTFRSVHGQKIFTSANKIFTLSKYYPVGIMIYGNALFHETPWETIIKVYRQKLGKKKFQTAEGYAKNFLAYLKTNRVFSSEQTQNIFARHMIESYFEFIKQDLLKQIAQLTDPTSGKGVISTDQIPAVISLVINKHADAWTKAPKGPNTSAKTKSEILRKYKDVIDQSVQNVFEKLPLTALHKQKLTQLSAAIFLNKPVGINAPNRSGIVIAGFGERDIYPQCMSYKILGVAANHLIYFEDEHAEIGTKSDATIAPFAQDDVAKSFIGGVDPRYESLIRQELDQILDGYPKLILDALNIQSKIPKSNFQAIEKQVSELVKKKRAEYKRTLEHFRHEKYITPTLRVVSMLPKDELANMAETLVNLTSFKRRVSMADETVGGPVDVAVISKGDGFVWIKRKHYFDKDMNPSFAANYFNGCE
jgi:hypothetical protein